MGNNWEYYDFNLYNMPFLILLSLILHADLPVNIQKNVSFGP